MGEPLFDLVEVEIKPPHNRRVMQAAMTRQNAEATMYMAIARRGVERHFYVIEPSEAEPQP